MGLAQSRSWEPQQTQTFETSQFNENQLSIWRHEIPRHAYISPGLNVCRYCRPVVACGENGQEGCKISSLVEHTGLSPCPWLFIMAFPVTPAVLKLPTGNFQLSLLIHRKYSLQFNETEPLNTNIKELTQPVPSKV